MSTHQEDFIEGFKFFLFLAIIINGLFWFFAELNQRLNEDQNNRYQICVQAGMDQKQCYRKIINSGIE